MYLCVVVDVGVAVVGWLCFFSVVVDFATVAGCVVVVVVVVIDVSLLCLQLLLFLLLT